MTPDPYAALAELVRCADAAGRGAFPESDGYRWPEAWAAARAALAQRAEPVATFSETVVLPDGSAFATASFPLPKDHWLYAPRGEWDSERDESSECPLPILTNAQRGAVTAAVRYAVRGATMCGQEADFDPDALVQNACYALCGPYNAAPPPAPQAPVADGSTEKTGTVPWPVVESYSGGADPAGIGGRVWLRMGDGPETVEYVPAPQAQHVSGAAAPVGSPAGEQTGPVSAAPTYTPQAQPEPVSAADELARLEPMSDRQIRDLVQDCGLDWHLGFAPLFDGDDTNRYAVLAHAIERAVTERLRGQS